MLHVLSPYLLEEPHENQSVLLDNLRVTIRGEERGCASPCLRLHMYRDDFFRFYANLPLNLRDEVILTMEEAGGPITWKVAYREIEGETEIGEKILEKLVRLKFIPVEDEQL